MKIEVWSDYVCPFCYIGKRRLEDAIKESGLEEVEVIYKAFELEPNSIATSDESMIKVLAEKYKISIEEAKAMTDNVALQAQSVGLNYDFKKMRPANTFHAHRLAKFAEQEGLGEQMTEQLLHAYFIEGEKIGMFETLVELAKKLGLSEERTNEMLHSEEFVDEVKADIKEAGQIGVQGVPFFVINRKYAISGAQPTETFVKALQKAANETV
ncbi:DsbA family oxidoreductase [Sporosarcina ureilytica]|uniref:Disulfide bond formation protein DsbA n=1 Tax=Sporosarcina ureilytica TaxID=298596 RepID=A0A1D8JD55_9BACL|nr:DsbA family oxidoreductase [Sporosarcina ureilytica]AOV06632.1 disulfide bond formation protein DsbA [Sporosarcina ureilytica]